MSSPTNDDDLHLPVEDRKRKEAPSAADVTESTTEKDTSVEEKDNKPNNNNKSRRARKKKKTKEEAKANHTRKKEEDPSFNDTSKDPNAGSFANEAQRKLFNVELPEEEDPDIAQTRVKRKVAFLLGYLGTNYSGFQINEGQRTLQGDFELALLRNHHIMRSNFGYPWKYGW